MFGERYEWLIGLRYLRAKHGQRFISVITFLSVGGMALGVAALIVVLAVMTGFKEELQKQILGVTSHVVVQSYSGRMADYQSVLEQARSIPRVEGAAPFVLGQVMLTQRGNAAGVMVRGIDPELEAGVSALQNNLIQGKLADLPGFGIILGQKLAINLGVRMGSQLTMLAPNGNITIAGTTPRMKRFTVVGIFDSGMHEYDSNLSYIALEDAQTLFRLGDRVTGIEVRTTHPDLAFSVRATLEKRLLGAYWIRDWMQMNMNFFRALKIEKATMFVILFLVVVVAAFNIISSLIMVVMEKGRDIAILMTMGAARAGIMTIFVINGAVIGIAGTLSGVTLGLALAFNLEAVLGFIERVFGIQIMSGEVYFIDHLPSVVEPLDVTLIAVGSLLLSFGSTLYPAWRAARIDPVEALRYE